MGQRQDYLKSIVVKRFGSHTHSKLTNEDVLKYSAKISKTYFELTGQLKEVPIKFGPWDISTKDFIIELDEERHFNRYRLLTLKSDIYNSHSKFSVFDYKRYCKTYEKACLRAASWGKNWKTDSTEKMFAISDKEGHLEKCGSSRWKQRAYYDFLKDIASQIKRVPVIRISVYDTYKGFTVDTILRSTNDRLINELIDGKVKQHCG